MTDDTLRLTEELNIRYGEDRTDKLIRYIDMILERNEHINLTAVRDRDEAMIKHLADSLTITELPQYVGAGKVIDVGTGAGFPGALLAIADPDKEFVLLDSTLKRLKVIDEFAESLGISNIRTLHARAEEISLRPEYNESFDLCVSRAVAGLDKLAGWSLPFVRKGGYFISYKGENYQTEIDNSQKIIRRHGGEVTDVITTGNGYPGISGHVLVVITKGY